MGVVTVDYPRPRERSLWPLAAILLVGAFVIAGAIFAASHVSSGDSAEQPKEARLLDSLTIDARLVTPPGTRELRLTRHHVCPRRELDSSATEVERELRLDADLTPQAGLEAVMSLYLRHGWVRDAENPLGTLAKGPRSLWISGGGTTGHALTVYVEDSGESC